MMDDFEAFRIKRPAPPPPAPLPVEELSIALPEDSIGRIEILLHQAMLALQTSQRQRDARTVLSAIKEARSCLELTAKLKGEIQAAAVQAVQVNVSNAAASADADLDASLEGLMAQVRQRTNTAPVCGACGEPCSACASELAGISHRRPALALEQPALDVEVVEETPAETPESPAQPRPAVRPAVVPQGVTEPHKGRDDGPNAQLVRQDGGWRL